MVGLLQGLLRSRLVAEELAQETFLVAYRHWGRVSTLDNPRAWVRKVALNQRGSFLRACLRQQAREQRSVVREEADMNADDRLRAAADSTLEERLRAADDDRPQGQAAAAGPPPGPQPGGGSSHRNGWP